jgi:hypothetical protein
MKEGTGGHTKIIRAQLSNGSLKNLFTGPNTTKGQHLALNCFLIIVAMYIFYRRTGRTFCKPTRYYSDGGKIYRLNDDGTIPKTITFIGTKRSKRSHYTSSEIETLKNNKTSRITGAIWAHEHGP